jgi:rfaE bifunctional protein kinase chain/domain
VDEQRLRQLLERFPDLTIAVLGDFFLDRYLVLESSLTEKSLETGLDCYQIVAKRHSPGAAGTVTSNLRALRVGTVLAVGVIGDDGEGFELRRALDQIGVDQERLLTRGDLFTPTYTKPMLREAGKERELNRLDVKNRQPMPPEVEDAIIEHLRQCVPQADAVIVGDQVQERNFGVVTDRVRGALAEMAAHEPTRVFFVDSRTRIGEFRNMILKPNRHEAVRAVRPDFQGEPTMEQLEEAARTLMRRSGRPVYVTLGERGILLLTGEGPELVPGIRVEGEIDIVGAGDSTTAGIVSALCAGATFSEAALIGNIVASITIQQIGTTGTARPEQVMERFRSL